MRTYDHSYRFGLSLKQSLRLRRNRWKVTIGAAALSLALLPVVATAVNGVKLAQNVKPNPNDGSVGEYCSANYPGTQGIVFSTGSSSTNTQGEVVKTEGNFTLTWTEAFASNTITGEIVSLINNTTSDPVSYVAAFLFAGGNDAYLFATGTPVFSNLIGGTPPADQLIATDFNGQNFSHWGFCAYPRLVPVSVKKNIVGGGTGTFTFSIDCRIATSTTTTASFTGYPLDLVVTVTTGGTATAQSPVLVPEGAACTVTEKPGIGDEALYAHEGPQTVDPAIAPIVTFNNVRKVGKLSFTKTIINPITGEDPTFTFSLDCTNDTYDVATFTLPSGGSLTYTTGEIPVGVSCSVTEAAAPGYTTTGSPTASTAVVAGQTTAIAGITNTRNVGYFRIAKTTSDSSTAVFTFEVTCGTAATLTIPLPGGSLSGVFGPYPTGTSCTIHELGDSPDRYEEAPDQTFSVGQNTFTTATTYTFTNRLKVGSLRFTKVVKGAVIGETPSFMFALNCSPDTPNSYDTTFSLPTATGSLVYEVADVLEGTTCTVTETGATPTSVWNVTGSPTAVATIEAGKLSELTITNERKRGSLVIKKVVDDGGPGPFSVDYSCAFGGTVVADGTDVGFSPTSPITVSDLPTGTVCTFTEDAAPGYTTSYSVVSPRTISEGVNEVVVTNKVIPPKLTLKKVVVKPATSTNATTAADWLLTNTPSTLVANTNITLTETPKATVTGTWIASEWVCAGSGLLSQSGSVIRLDRGADVTCTITNTLVDVLIAKDVAKMVGADCLGGDEVWVDQLSLVVATTPLCYRFTVTNTGSVTLDPVTVSDALLGLTNITCGSGLLTPGASASCIQASVAAYTAGAVRTNTAIVTGCATGTNTCVKDDDTATYVAAYQGFTPGFWKQHTAADAKNAWVATYIGACIPPLRGSTLTSTDYWNTPVTAIFPTIGAAPVSSGRSTVAINNYNGVGKPLTLVQALGLSGGSGDAGANGNLLRAAVASWLNACFVATDNPTNIGLTWPLSNAQIQAEVATSFGGTRAVRLALATKYDGWNNVATHFIDWSKSGQ
jgi:hypothetical protein